jgi:hypothetical protein
VIQRHGISVFLSDKTSRECSGFGIRLPSDFDMGDLVNLRTARKQAKRRQSEQEAAANRLQHGRPKRERTLTQAASDKAHRSLDQHRIETGDGQ